MTIETDEGIVFAGVADRATVLSHARQLVRSDPRAAAAQAREMLAVRGNDRDARLVLAIALRQLREDDQATQIEQALIEDSSSEPELVQSAQDLSAGRLHQAETILRSFLEEHPEDPVALRMLAEIAALAGARQHAVPLLEQSLGFAPSYRSSRLRLSKLLIEQGQISRALALLDEVVEGGAEALSVSSHAAALSKVGEYRQAASLYERLIGADPSNGGLWTSLGHLRNTLGELEGSIGAYRHALAINPGDGVAWWSLANLKTFRFSDDDIEKMERQLNSDVSESDEVPIRFALGKALEDRSEPEQSFHHYARGNQLRKTLQPYEASIITDLVSSAIQVLQKDLRWSAPDVAGPIFIVGMPRAGSTLIEQILSSHSLIEGTAELPIMPMLVRDLEDEEERPYPELLADLAQDRFTTLGQRYLEAARVYRKTDRPFFIDKLPNNWLHVPLIRRILPEARIIDARRHPLDCGWSLFKQNFARGQGFSYDLSDIGSYYRDYVRLMKQVDEQSPGRVHRVIHERLVDEGEAQIRAMLDYVGVPFEEGVLRFHENDRAVRTPSAAQVRKPINREGMERWRPFEPWLEPLKEALGDVLEAYPEVPATI